ncbi:MAG: phenylacetic acid degradation bifunctional protein PaaZ, partial [Caulobacteraceae bacterium]
MRTLESYALDAWVAPTGTKIEIRSAVTGEVVALAGSGGLDFAAMARHAREVGGPALRRLTFQDRARMLKALADALVARKEELYELSWDTGATRRDGWIDIEGGAGTFLAYASRGRRELPAAHLLIDGEAESLGKTGAFAGQHVWTTRQGVAVHINAFNFPIWGMLEKLAPALLAGMPAIVKPATASAQVAELGFRILIEAGVLPPGSLQLIIGPVGDLLDHLTGQDVVGFTGSAATAARLKTHQAFVRDGARFVAEQDSLNTSILGPDAGEGTPEFDLFIKEVVTEMTAKAGQKCTAIRRALVPAERVGAVQTALIEALGKVVVGDPRREGVTMGPLISLDQREAVRASVAELCKATYAVFGDPMYVEGPGTDKGAFVSPILLRTDSPWSDDIVHSVEAFGPVATLMPYKDLADAIALANTGKGSLVASLFTRDAAAAREVVLGAGAFHGRLAIVDRDSAAESTGHGSPLPGLVHGGPGRAGGGEEMGGLRGLATYMQRTAVQGSPGVLSSIIERQLPGAPTVKADVHPFRKRFGELELGYTLETGSRTITLEDIEHFAHFTGDTFYAH